ncbi:hypothetical protein [Morganella psychrotolerans]|uniref:hypothetical protein n=1 Tax=Morganella psychrotolerans TaxID=368603 RepID=UPI0039B10643
MRATDIPGYKSNIDVPLPTIGKNKLKPIQFDKMAERINYIQNTTMSFKLNNKEFTTDTREFSKNLLESICKLNLPVSKPGETPDAYLLLQAEKSLNAGIKEWGEQEKTTLISAFINRTIDQTCRTHHVKIGKDEKKNLFNEVKDKYFTKINLDPGCAQPSIIQSLHNNKALANEIIMPNVNDAIPDHTDGIMAERFNHFTGSPKSDGLTINERQNKQKELTQHILQYTASLNAERTSLKSDIYNRIAENIFNTFLCDKFYGGNSGEVDFDTIRNDIQNITLSRATSMSDDFYFIFPEQNLTVTTSQPIITSSDVNTPGINKPAGKKR